MKLAIYSDLHLEFQPFTPPKLDVDVVILAGDIGCSLDGLIWARDNFDQKVVYIPGNHEFYDGLYDDTLARMFDFSKKYGIHFLLNESVEIQDIEFVGTTLWTDFQLFNQRSDAIYDARKLDDFRKIVKRDEKNDIANLTPSDVLKLNSEALFFLEESFLKVVKKRVVITHHAPTLLSINPVYKEHYLTPCYASNFDGLVVASCADLWIHGHTHHNVNYHIAKTNVITNQRVTQPPI